MNEHRHQYAITTLCRVLQVARAGFYQWLHKPVSDREKENGRLLGLIRDSYAASRGVYGARRVFADLREAGESCGKHRVAALMLLMILLMLLVQYLQTNKAWRLLEHWHATTKERQQWLSWHAEENRELKSALRAEKAHVEQLQRKVEILQALLP